MTAAATFSQATHERLVASDALGQVRIAAVWRACTRASGRRGLLGQDSLPNGQALAISTCSVHMAGMRFALDLVWLDRHGRIVRIDQHVGPGLRMRTCLRARTCIELAAGQASELGLLCGEQLTLRADS